MAEPIRNTYTLDELRALYEEAVNYYHTDEDEAPHRVRWYADEADDGTARVIELWSDEEPVIAVADKHWPELFPGEYIAAMHNALPVLLDCAERAEQAERERDALREG